MVSNLFASLACLAWAVGLKIMAGAKSGLRIAHQLSVTQHPAWALAGVGSAWEKQSAGQGETAPKARCVEDEGSSQCLSICNCPAPRGWITTMSRGSQTWPSARSILSALKQGQIILGGNTCTQPCYRHQHWLHSYCRGLWNWTCLISLRSW